MTPRKLAIFVEGQAERLFVQHLLTEIAPKGELHIDSRALRGVGHGKQIWCYRLCESPLFFVLVVDCGNDDRVASEMRAQASRLASEGYERILGLRDLYPKKRQDQERLSREIARVLPQTPIPCEMVLAVMELEAWFIAEHTHFGRLIPGVSAEQIRGALNLDPASDDVRDLAHPSKALGQVYALGGHSYGKHEEEVERTVKHLDFAAVYTELRPRLPELDALLTPLDAFLTRLDAGAAP